MQLEVLNTEWHEQTHSYPRPVRASHTHILAECVDDLSVTRVERFKHVTCTGEMR